MEAVESDLVLDPPQPCAPRMKPSSTPTLQIFLPGSSCPLSLPSSPAPGWPRGFLNPSAPLGSLPRPQAHPSLAVVHQVLPTNSSQAAASPSLAHKLENTLGVGRGGRWPLSPHQSGHSVAVRRTEPPYGPSGMVTLGGARLALAVWPALPSGSGLQEPAPPSLPSPEGCRVTTVPALAPQKSQVSPVPCICRRREPRPPRPPLSKYLDRMPPPHPRGASGHLLARPAPRRPGQGLSTNCLELPEAGVTGSSLRNTLGNSKASQEATPPEGGSHHSHCVRTAPWQGLRRPPVWTYPPFMQGVGWRRGAQSAAAFL